MVFCYHVFWIWSCEFHVWVVEVVIMEEAIPLRDTDKAMPQGGLAYHPNFH
jgi:hypothetical protein